MSCYTCDIVSRFARGTRATVHVTTFFGYLREQLERVIDDYGCTVTTDGTSLAFITENVPEVIEKLFHDDRFSRDEKNNINLLVLRDGEQADMQTMQYMRPLPQWYQLVSAGELVNVIENKRLKVQFQPIVSLRDSNVYGYECLTRGIARDGSVIPPGPLFSQAGAIGLLFNLDRVVRENALRAAQSSRVPGFVFINFLPNAIYDPEFCLRTTMAVADETGLAHDRVVFEIVESEKFEDVAHLKRILRYYQERGVRTALDDVGSGYASLNTLAALKPDIMKLDMQLIRNIDTDTFKQSIFSGLERIARDNGILLLAEGVEREEELAFLAAHRVDLVQGYFFRRPGTVPTTSCRT